ncbi:sigma-54-dependent transcriptional regulator [Oceanospirillum sediminis]|uniref:Sigma-54-dependent Fis family transcriptional regulator n=1 Tax=Oceanospirillum sediminis TaxID=2760088 RepID=A0A839IVE3_9GAMM|nr:sigma-54 dependent transcriptional regulator [Oceanospirillum sediminis]MBB1488692.1 sigma-54-dependent Fis family transcriptional regulator [Oceanospirillum sediminis]
MNQFRTPDRMHDQHPSELDLTATRARVLVVDDEIRSLETLERILDESFDVLTASSASDALSLLEQCSDTESCSVQVIVCDQRMPGMTGVEFLTQVRQRWPETIRLMLSGYTDSEDIIAGINEAGIYQYLTKPWHPDQLLLAVGNASKLWQLQQQNELLAHEMRLTADTAEGRMQRHKQKLKSSFQLEGICRGENSPLEQLCDEVSQVAPYDIAVLITGESGTGKELFARAVHYTSHRADQPFVVENCGAMPDELLASELFGHKKGAFTGAVADHVGLFEQADGGTIFLDEIGEITPAFQVKLLRVLQEREVRPVGSHRRRKIDVRIVASTNRDLQEEVRAGRFRQDLYYRLAQITLTLPPLRERGKDISVLAQNILEKAQQDFNKPVKGFSLSALACMQAYHWPGNVRELENEVRRMLVMTKDDELGPELLAPHVLRAAPEDDQQDRELTMLGGMEGTLKDRIEALEARIVKETLLRFRWNKSRAANELGLSRVGLRSKIERYGIDQPN